MENANKKIYNLIKAGQFHDALQIAEKNYISRPDAIESLVDYVKILLEFKLFEKAEKLINDSGLNPSDDPNIFYLYHDLYTRWPNLKKLRSLNKKYTPDIHVDENIVDLSRNEAIIRPDKIYFKDQLLFLLKYFIKNYPKHHKTFKKTHLRIVHDRIEEGLYLLKEFALNCVDKNLGMFVYAEMKLVEQEFQKAKSKYERLLDDFEPRWLLLNRLGDIELALSNEDRAETYYLQAYELNPNDIDTNLDLIRTYVLKGDIKKAKSHYNKSVKKFGVEKVGFIKNHIQRLAEKGINIVNGLVWYEGGGSILPIEFKKVDMAGENLHPTGNLGFSILDSMHLAYNIARMSPLVKEIDKIDRISIQVNVPESIVYKDGPSAGLAFLVGILSEMLARPIPNRVAYTGEITLSGAISPVGGIKGKLTAAHLNGMETVYIPKENFGDLLKIDNSVKSKMKIKLIDHYNEVLDDIWMT